MKVQGQLIYIGDTQQVSEKFMKRDFAVRTNEQYPQEIGLQLTQDSCALLDTFQLNQEIDVDVNLRGRAWTSPQGEVKYFNTLQAWRITLTQSQQPAAQPARQSTQPQQPITPLQEEEQDDLPF